MDILSDARYRGRYVQATLVLLFAVLALSLAGPALAADSDLDPTFGNDGKVTTDIATGNDDGRAMAIDANGKILVAGSGQVGAAERFALARYNLDGALDTGFGNGGKVTTAVGTGNSHGHALTIDASGNILVAGESDNGLDEDFALVRYTSSGLLDGSFGSNGVVVTDFGSSDDRGYAVAIDAGGKILVAGTTNGGPNSDFALARYNSDGSLDSGFGNGGVVTTDFSSSNENGNAIAIDASGKILVAGTTDIGLSDDFALVRYESNGSLDGGFGSGGKVTTDFSSSNDYGYALAIDAVGKILVAGDTGGGSNRDMALARYLSNGALDSGFGSGGKVTTDFGSSNDYGYAISIDADGKIIVVGTSDLGSNNDFALARYYGNGALDYTFGSAGKVTTAVGANNDQGRTMAIDSDGKILVAGTSHNGANDDLALVRYGTAPEINVLGNGVTIANGDTTPSSANHTDFGSAGIESGSVVRTFTVANRGNATLELGANAVTLSGAQSGHFSVTDPVAPTVAPDTSTPFEITFDPSATGTFTATVSIANNDSEQNPYTFTIQGTGVSQSMPEPRLAVAKSADVVEAIIGETTVSYAYRVTNIGDVTLQVEALDNVLGPVPLFLVPEGTELSPAVPLAPDKEAVGAHSYAPQLADLPGPLVNSVVVTGTDPNLSTPVSAVDAASVDLLLRSEDEMMYDGAAITFKFEATVDAAAGQTFDLVVFSGPAPEDLLLKGVEQITPYTGSRSMVDLTNQLLIEGCPGGVACNQVTRTVFDEDGNYHVETIDEVQPPTELYLPVAVR